MTLESLQRLKEIIDRLRAPDGCPWDREQTSLSLKPYLLEEAHETAEAIEGGEPEAIREELGDLLMNVFLQARIGEEDGTFTLGDVADGIADKLVRRHPHVFGDDRAATADDVRRSWEEIKRSEKPETESQGVLRKLPATLPALSRGMRVGRMAAEAGFDWPDPAGPLAKVREEVEELAEAMASGDEAGIAGEVGDLLFAITSLCRHVDVDGEAALRGAIAKFGRRFARIEKTLLAEPDASLQRLEELWKDAKSSDE